MRTDVYTFPAAYAFERVRVRRWIYSHPAGFRAGGTSVAFCFIHAHSENSRAVEKRIKRAERAEIFAERSENQHACQNNNAEHTDLPREHRAEKFKEAGIGKSEQYARESARRAEIFAEKRREFHAQRQNNHKSDQDYIFYPPQVFITFKGFDFFEKRDFEKQILKEAEGTEKAADESARDSSEKYEKSENIVRESEFRSRERALERTDRAGARGGGAGVAVEPRHADIFCRRCRNSACEKSPEIRVVQKG